LVVNSVAGRKGESFLDFALDSIPEIVAAEQPRAVKAKALADFIRSLRLYRWVGVYDVGPESVSAIAWSGPDAPAYPVFPVTSGLTSTAIREKKTIIVGDVRKDPRYLTALGNTLSEMIVPVLDFNRDKVIGTIDVESELANAFSAAQAAECEEVARLALPLWTLPLSRPDSARK
jgi:putative methionine-R-sulfoxide reductase with GAF domain